MTLAELVIRVYEDRNVEATYFSPDRSGAGMPSVISQDLYGDLVAHKTRASINAR